MDEIFNPPQGLLREEKVMEKRFEEIPGLAAIFYGREVRDVQVADGVVLFCLGEHCYRTGNSISVIGVFREGSKTEKRWVFHDHLNKSLYNHKLDFTKVRFVEIRENLVTIVATTRSGVVEYCTLNL